MGPVSLSASDRTPSWLACRPTIETGPQLQLWPDWCCADAVDPDAKAMEEGGLKLPRARELARLVFGEDLEALAGQSVVPPAHSAFRTH